MSSSLSSSLLTEKQRQELHVALAAYFHANGMNGALAGLQADLEGEAGNFELWTQSKYADLLVKKWTSILRLQRKLMETEEQVKQLQQQLQNGMGMATPWSRGASSSAASSSAASLPVRLCQTWTGHRLPVLSVLVHGRYSLVASASEDAMIQIQDWMMAEGEVQVLRGHTKAVNGLAWDSTGWWLISASSDLTLKCWLLDWEGEQGSGSWKCVRTLHGHDHTVSSVVCVKPVTSNSVSTAALSGGGETGAEGKASTDWIVSASRDKTIKIWELSTGYCLRTLHGHDDWVRSIASSEDGHFIVSASNDQTVRIWEVTTGQCTATLRGHEHVVECAVFLPDACASVVQDLQKKHGPAVGDVNISDSKGGTPKLKPKVNASSYVVSGSRDKTIKLWHVPTGQCIHTFTGHDNWVRGLTAIVPAQLTTPPPTTTSTEQTTSEKPTAYVVSVSDDKSIRAWCLRTGRMVHQWPSDAHRHFVQAISSTQSQGRVMMCTGGVDQQVKLWSA